MPGACYTNDAALPPAFVAAFECLAHHIDVTNALKAVVDTTARHLDQVINDVIDFARIHKVRHAELGRQRFFVSIEIDADDAPCADQLGALNHVQSNAAQAKYGNGRTGLDVHGEGDGTDAGGDATADVADLVEGRVLSHFCHGDLGQHGVVGEGRTAHVVKYRFAIQRETAGAVRHQALALSLANRLTQIGLGMQAEIAGAALRCV